MMQFEWSDMAAKLTMWGGAALTWLANVGTTQQVIGVLTFAIGAVLHIAKAQREKAEKLKAEAETRRIEAETQAIIDKRRRDAQLHDAQIHFMNKNMGKSTKLTFDDSQH